MWKYRKGFYLHILFLKSYFNLNKILFFRIVFVLYFFKLSGKSGFWRKLGDTDKVIRKMAIVYQKWLLKVEKVGMDLKLLYKCNNEFVYPKSGRWKHLKDKPVRSRKQLY